MVLRAIWFICLIQTLDSDTNTSVGKSKELSIDLKDHIIDLNKSGKSLGAISQQFQVPASTVQQLFVRIKFTVSLPPSNYHLLLRENCSDGQDSTRNHQKPSLQWIRSCWKTGVWVHRQVCFTSTWAERLLCWQNLLIQTQNLEAGPKFPADHLDGEETFWRKTSLFYPPVLLFYSVLPTCSAVLLGSIHL